MNDIDRLEARLTLLETGPYLYMVAASKLDALVARVAALERQGNRVGGTVPESSAVTSASPAPPAPRESDLPREMARAALEACAPSGTYDFRPSWPDDVQVKAMRAALLVAAEELLGEITLDEWEDACTRYGSNAPGATTNGVLRSRLARAKEAAK